MVKVSLLQIIITYMERIRKTSNNKYVGSVETVFLTIDGFGGMIGEKWGELWNYLTFIEGE